MARPRRANAALRKSMVMKAVWSLSPLSKERHTVKFYLVGNSFILFDIEIVFLCIPGSTFKQFGGQALVAMILFGDTALRWVYLRRRKKEP